ncbi:hypothetical protein N665_0198s0001 [Sinapis alba]|nr:hypothetical protein N665_0198s0001 [Sinapis alba]
MPLLIIQSSKTHSILCRDHISRLCGMRSSRNLYRICSRRFNTALQRSSACSSAASTAHVLTTFRAITPPFWISQSTKASICEMPFSSTARTQHFSSFFSRDKESRSSTALTCSHCVRHRIHFVIQNARGMLCIFILQKHTQITEVGIRYFKKKPLLGRNGMPIVPKPPVLFSTMAMFRLYTGLRFKLPLQILGLLSITLPSQFGDKYQSQSHKFKMAMRLVKLYEPYLLFKGIFDDRNLETLRIKNEAKEMNDLPGFTPKCIDWEDYFINIHIPGLVTHVLNK